MNQQQIEWAIRSETLTAIKKQTGRAFVPLGISNRHIHLSQKDLETLFGTGYQLTELKPLSQYGQYAAKETVRLVGPKGSFEKVRILGPVRKETQVEISLTDSYTLGIKPVIRMSGDISGTPGAEIVGPKGSVTISAGVIVAARHLHISTQQAEVFGLKDGDVISLHSQGARAVCFDQVAVRSADDFDLEVHLDMDEANAAALKNGDYLEILA